MTRNYVAEPVSSEASQLERLPTPALLVDMDRFDANVKLAEELFHPTGKVLRPHVKTHRTPELAVLQQSHCARGVTCATVGEAEAMVDVGIDDVLIANEVVSLEKIERIARLAARARILVAVDSRPAMELLSLAAMREQTTIDVLIDVDVGLNRCGVRSDREAVILGWLVATAPGLRLAGLMGYEGRLRASNEKRAAKFETARTSIEGAKAAMESEGLPVGIVSGAGTATLMEALESPVLTEIQAGTYVFMEKDLEGLRLPFTYAVSVLATVISVWSEGAVLDAGRKSIGCEHGLPEALLPGATVFATNEEHTILHTATPPPLTTRVMLVPTKVPTTFNLHDRAWLTRGSHVERSVPVSARGGSD
jgi:D-serine deaminase-like pyridoxal phosphate-dependent protein